MLNKTTAHGTYLEMSWRLSSEDLPLGLIPGPSSSSSSFLSFSLHIYRAFEEQGLFLPRLQSGFYPSDFERTLALATSQLVVSGSATTAVLLGISNKPFLIKVLQLLTQDFLSPAASYHRHSVSSILTSPFLSPGSWTCTGSSSEELGP